MSRNVGSAPIQGGYIEIPCHAGDTGTTQYFDERIEYGGVEVDWATLIASAKTGGSRTENDVKIGFVTTNTTNKWTYLERGSLRFDTSLIPAGATIISAKIRVVGHYKANDGNNNPDINLFNISRDNNYTYGTTPLATAISYGSWNIAGNNDFTLNAAGLAEIVTGGKTYIGVRNANYDAAATSPTWVLSANAAVYFWSADYGQPPLLMVTYAAVGKGTKYLNGYRTGLV